MYGCYFGTFLCCHVREVPKIKIEVLQAFSNICKITGVRFMKSLKRAAILLLAVIMITPVYSVPVYALKDKNMLLTKRRIMMNIAGFGIIGLYIKKTNIL